MAIMVYRRQKYTLCCQNTLFQHWEYTFAPLKLQCRHCSKKIKACNRSGSNLRTHYKCMHADLLSEMSTSVKNMTKQEISELLFLDQIMDDNENPSPSSSKEKYKMDDNNTPSTSNRRKRRLPDRILKYEIPSSSEEEYKMDDNDTPSTSNGQKRKLPDCILKYEKYFKTSCPEFSSENDDMLQLQCRNCPRKIRTSNRSGSNLRTHYKSVHADLFIEMSESVEKMTKKEIKPTVTGAKQFPVVSKNTASTSAGKSMKRISVHTIADYIIEDMQPMSIVEKTGFRKLLEELKPGCVVPDQRAVVGTVEVSLNLTLRKTAI